MVDQETLREVVVFMVHAIKRMMYAFECLEEVTIVADEGSPAIALYIDGIYGYTSAFFLLNNKLQGRQGAFQATLKPYGLTGLLDQAYGILEEPLGSTTFGEVIRVFRNKALVHSSYCDADVEKIYKQVDMLDPQVRQDFQDRLEQLRDACGHLAFALAKAAKIDPDDLGIKRG